MVNIKIITFQRAYNYGAVLQAFALQKKLSQRYLVEVIDYRNEMITLQYNPYKVMRPGIKWTLSNIKMLLFHRKKMIQRFNSFENFILKKLKLTKTVIDKEQIMKFNNETDVYITGSDQVWNPGLTRGLSDVYSLNFEAKDKKKISYAASIGDVSQIDKFKDSFIVKISKLNHISVREADARHELEKIINKKIQTVLDPTLLLTKKEWDNEINCLPKNNEKYIVAYVVKPDETYLKIVNDLSEKTGLKVLHFGINNPGYKNVWKSAYTEGPLEFVNYIKNAEYVVTTSFHATVFSIIFNKKFFIIPHRQTGSRVTNLLEQLGIDNRVYYSLDEFKNIDYKFDTDWEKVEKKLEEERERSLNWLINAIEGKEDKNV